MPKGKRSTIPAMLCSAQCRESAKAYMPLTPVTRAVLRAMYIEMFMRYAYLQYETPPLLPSPLQHFLTFSSFSQMCAKPTNKPRMPSTTSRKNRLNRCVRKCRFFLAVFFCAGLPANAQACAKRARLNWTPVSHPPNAKGKPCQLQAGAQLFRLAHCCALAVVF